MKKLCTPRRPLHPLMHQGIEQANKELRLRILRRLQLDPNVIVDAETYNLLNKS